MSRDENDTTLREHLHSGGKKLSFFPRTTKTSLPGVTPNLAVSSLRSGTSFSVTTFGALPQGQHRGGTLGLLITLTQAEKPRSGFSKSRNNVQEVERTSTGFAGNHEEIHYMEQKMYTEKCQRRRGPGDMQHGRYQRALVSGRNLDFPGQLPQVCISKAQDENPSPFH